ncbi:MAG: ribonuclease HIII [Metamycoplasmataceae bacterium]
MAKTKKEIKESKYANEKLKLIDITKNNINDYSVIGVDESGVGDYLTPLVAAAVFVDKNDIEKFKKMGIDDSKKISDSKILELGPKIREMCKYGINMLSQKGYNSLNKYMNAHELKMFLHLKCINFIENNLKDEKIDFILIDKYSTVDSIKNYYENFMKNTRLQTFPIKNNVALEEKAESLSIAVAAASILAREKLLKLMEEQEEELEMKFPLGTNEIVEKAAIEFIKKYNRKNLYNVAKISFKTTKKIDDLLALEK